MRIRLRWTISLTATVATTPAMNQGAVPNQSVHTVADWSDGTVIYR